jgi:uncharacterized protein (DUF302 family)
MDVLRQFLHMPQERNAMRLAKFALPLLLGLATGLAFAQSSGLASRGSSWTVDETVAKIESAAKDRGITVFAKIDHAAEAKKAGLQMPPTVLLIVGNPKAGTPMMLEKPSTAIDLPLKILIAQGADGKAVVTLNEPAFVRGRHGLSEDVARPLGGAAGLVDAALK